MLHDLARPKAHVQQAFHHAQFLYLLGGIAAFAMDIALRLRKGVAALPHAQRFLGQARIALDIADAVHGGGWHAVLVCIHTGGLA